MLDNIFLKTAYRIHFHTWWDCLRSLFMLHNETMNVWSHLIGAIMFFSSIFYVIFYVQPTSVHDAKLIDRWSQDFDTGRFDMLMCGNPDFAFAKPDQCPYRVDEILEDLLETEQLLSWH